MSNTDDRDLYLAPYLGIFRIQSSSLDFNARGRHGMGA